MARGVLNLIVARHAGRHRAAINDQRLGLATQSLAATGLLSEADPPCRAKAAIGSLWVKNDAAAHDYAALAFAGSTIASVHARGAPEPTAGTSPRHPTRTDAVAVRLSGSNARPDVGTRVRARYPVAVRVRRCREDRGPPSRGEVGDRRGKRGVLRRPDTGGPYGGRVNAGVGRAWINTILACIYGGPLIGPGCSRASGMWSKVLRNRSVQVR